MIEICGMIFTAVIGCLLHFTYEWSGRSFLVTLIAPTNESIFEHLKLLLTPYLLWMLNEYVRYGRFMENFILSKLLGVLAGMALIIFGFFAYTALCGRNFLLADIFLFFLSVAVSFGLSYLLMILPLPAGPAVRIGSDITLILLILCFAVCSVFPPKGRLFDVTQGQMPMHSS